MPDPEPDFSPCEAILKIAPGEELRQPTEAELQQLLALTPTPTVGDSAETPTAIAAIPPTPRPITGETAEEIILNSGCGACHLIGEHGESGKVGPNLSNIGNLAGDACPDSRPLNICATQFSIPICLSHHSVPTESVSRTSCRAIITCD